MSQLTANYCTCIEVVGVIGSQSMSQLTANYCPDVEVATPVGSQSMSQPTANYCTGVEVATPVGSQSMSQPTANYCTGVEVVGMGGGGDPPYDPLGLAPSPLSPAPTAVAQRKPLTYNSCGRGRQRGLLSPCSCRVRLINKN